MKRDKGAPEEVREQVRTMLEQQWREPVAVSYFRLKGVVLPGRPILPVKILLLIGAAIIALPLLIVHTVAELFGIELSWRPGSGSGQFTVKGPKKSLAVPVGKVLLGVRGDLWLAWNQAHVALVGDGRILWHAAAQARPSLDPAKAELTWPDGSTASLELSDAERARIQERNGRP